MLWYGSAAIGLLAWTVAVAVQGLPLALVVFLAGPLVLVPLTLSLLPEQPRWVWRGIAGLQLPAALLLLTLSAPLSIAWLLVTALIALAGFLHMARHRAMADLGIAAGLIYLVVGGGWSVLARYGARPLDFSDAIVQATATHFHYAGFILPVLAGLAARRLGGRWSALTVAAVVAGVPLVALGITLSALGVRWVEWCAAWFMAAAGLLMALQQFRLARLVGGWRGGLFLLSGASLAVGMALAALYALGNCLGADWLDIPLMIRTHGVINAAGFALPGLLAHVEARNLTFAG
jgi:hypothetical protein